MKTFLQTDENRSSRNYPSAQLADGSSEVVTRQGATLSEVLVSLLIMAIGVVSLASLFPISVLKTARASQLTVATNIRYNAESMMHLYPFIFTDPDPRDANGDFRLFNDYNFAQGQPFLFDPLAAVAGRVDPMPGASDYTAVPFPCGVGLLNRFGGGFNSSNEAAEAICGGPDSWTLRHEGSITVMDPTRTQMNLSDLNLNFSSLPNGPGGVKLPGANQMRAQIFFNGGKSSVTRMITGIGPGNTLMWTEDLNGNNTLDIAQGEDQNNNYGLDLHTLPGGITYESARLESHERRYTWLLTVRPQDVGSSFSSSLVQTNFDVDVVVYYGRGLTNDEELIFGTQPQNSTVQIPNLVGGSALLLSDGNNSFTVSWPNGQQPYLKRGGYILDAQNGLWYQIENYSDPGIGNVSVVTLTSVILKSSTLVMFPRGVVDVFPIGAQHAPL
jgi:hypothetical protein